MMKNNIYFLTVISLFLVLSACNKEDPLPVSSEFTTNIQNNTLTSREGYTVYTSKAKGEFLTYFKGDKEESSFGTGYGTSLEVGSDSLVLSSYGAEGTYTFTLVAISYGNWGETVLQEETSIEITVVVE
jgi:hypothetical protein